MKNVSKIVGAMFTIWTLAQMASAAAAGVSAYYAKLAALEAADSARAAEDHDIADDAFVGPGFVDSFTVACGSSATQIVPPSGLAQLSYSCQAPQASETGGTTLIAVGDSLIADPAIGTRNSPVYSGDTIREWYGDVRTEYCRADTGTVTVFCRAMVAASSAP